MGILNRNTPMEAFLIAVLCLAVIVLAIKLNRLVDAQAALSELGDLTRRLEQRLTNLERQVAGKSQSPVAKESQPIPAAARSMAPIQPITPVAPATPQTSKVARPDFTVPATIKPVAPEPMQHRATTTTNALLSSTNPPQPGNPPRNQPPGPSPLKSASARTGSARSGLSSSFL